jgi:tetratricopeptide (TPR) repeat protein
MDPLPGRDHFCIVARLMRIRFAILFCIALVAATTSTGCDEISARRKVQEANEQYKNARYAEACKLYEEALKKSPDLAIAHHNLGVCYYRQVKPGDSSPENQKVADQATDHLMAYLKTSDDSKEQVLIRKLVTEIWVSSSQHERAIAFWEAEHQAHPQDVDVIEQLADLNYKHQDWRKAIEWLKKALAIAQTDDDKAHAYSQIGNLAFLKLLNNRDAVQGAERIELADTGIGALQKGLKIQPKNMQMVSTLASLNQQRALASGSRIGFHIDLAEHQNFMRVFSVLREEAKKAQAAAAPQGGGT